MGETRNAYKILVRKPKGKRSLGRCRRKWEGNITMDIREIGWEKQIGFSWLRTGASNEPSASIKGREFLD
jgi:hypothetical protein